MELLLKRAEKQVAFGIRSGADLGVRRDCGQRDDHLIKEET